MAFVKIKMEYVNDFVFIKINLSFKSICSSQRKKIHKSVYNQNTVGYQYKSSGRQ